MSGPGGRGRRRWSWARELCEMVPNWALEKHAWSGAGLIWKRIRASNTTNRQQEEQAQQRRSQRRTQRVKEASSQLPFKALPLIAVWDASYRDTYHKDFEANKADGTQQESSEVHEMDTVRSRATQVARSVRVVREPWLGPWRGNAGLCST